MMTKDEIAWILRAVEVRAKHLREYISDDLSNKEMRAEYLLLSDLYRKLKAIKIQEDIDNDLPSI